jgi:hypothetical protein
MAKSGDSKAAAAKGAVDLQQVSYPTDRKQLFWLKGKKEELDVRRIPIKHLFFNIENGRYADKMIQLREDNSGVHIDPRLPEWQKQIFLMLKGEYPGTDADRDPFHKLLADIKDREQLRPGVVLQDGAVLDGNRRLAVLLELHATQANPERFAYLDAVILPSDVPAIERWRIEAGLQLGRDEQLDYSPINRLLKIREGLELFSKQHLPQGSKPEQMIADSLFGVTSDVIEENIERLRLIDQYLSFIKRPGAYHLIGERMERFIEAVNVLRAAKKHQWPAERVANLVVSLFAHIRDVTMDNYELRKVTGAIVGKKSTTVSGAALDEWLQLDGNVQEIQEKLSSSTPKSSLAPKLAEKAQDFLEAVEAAKATGQPARLAGRALKNLEALHQALESSDLKNHQGWPDRIKPVPQLISAAIKLGQKCLQRVMKLQTQAAKVQKPSKK